MDTNRLRQFCTIAETGSMTKAAKLLHITHSGLSKSMRILQNELNMILLQPAGRGISLTDQGLLIYQRAKVFLLQEEEFLKIDITPSSIMRIGTMEIFLLGISSYYKEYFSTPLKLLDLDPGKIEQMIAAKDLDFGITYVPFPCRDVEIIEIGKYKLGCYHLKGMFKQMDFADIPFVTPAMGLSDNPSGIKERDGWIEDTIPRHKKYSVNLLSTAIELSLRGMCAIFIPEFLANSINSHRHPKHRLVELALPRNNKVIQHAYFLHHKNRLVDNQCKQLIKLMKNVINQ